MNAATVMKSDRIKAIVPFNPKTKAKKRASAIKPPIHKPQPRPLLSSYSCSTKILPVGRNPIYTPKSIKHFCFMITKNKRRFKRVKGKVMGDTTTPHNVPCAKSNKEIFKDRYSKD